MSGSCSETVSQTTPSGNAAVVQPTMTPGNEPAVRPSATTQVNVKISDACHGSEGFNENYNVLKCETGSQICIIEVRYYTKQGCYSEQLIAPIRPECCRHDLNECSETSNPEAWQHICNGRNQCRVLSRYGGTITTPCPGDFKTRSSVRSITYRCSTSGSYSETTSEITTPPSWNSGSVSPNVTPGNGTAVMPTPTTQVNVKISDACHGLEGFNENYNVLKCETGSQICIIEVRYYTKQGCYSEQLIAPIRPECCRHDLNECSETSNPAALQHICNGRNQCRVLSRYGVTITTPCPGDFKTRSSVRSITYRCSTSGSCPETA
ncbi:uncharacterized protein LOC135462275 [Liolophura sinensis]|uniref:uncharacterized protein LOC135462275 n=1 Tax=Liolophura sinensis TaxID=3198878 RepID=UPI0031587763